MFDVGADPALTRGRPPSLASGVTAGIGRAMSDPTQRATGGMTTACLDTEIQRNTGNPQRRGRVTRNRTPARERPGRLGWRRGP